MKEVRFVAFRPPYRIGDIAKFDDEGADYLVKNVKVAEYVSRPLDSKVEEKNIDKPPKDKMMKSEEIKTK